MNIFEEFNFGFDTVKIFGVEGNYFVFAFMILFALPMLIYITVDSVVQLVRYYKSLKGKK